MALSVSAVIAIDNSILLPVIFFTVVPTAIPVPSTESYTAILFTSVTVSSVAPDVLMGETVIPVTISLKLPKRSPNCSSGYSQSTSSLNSTSISTSFTVSAN